MRYFRLATILLLCSCLLSTSLAADTWVIREDGVGPVKIGMTLAQLQAVLRTHLKEDDSSGSDNCYYLTAPGHDHVGFMIIDGRLARIDVNAPNVATTTGLKVGDTEARVDKIYGARMKVTAHQYVDGGHYLTVRSTDGHYGVRFETDGTRITGYYAGTYEAIQYVEGCL
jgi:hypothetical protein